MGKQLTTAVLLGMIGLGSIWSQAARAEEPKKSDKIRVILIDGQNNHDWKKTTPHLKKMLEECGRFTVHVSTTPQKDGTEMAGPDRVHFPPDLSKYDVLLSNYNNYISKVPWPDSLQKTLEDSLRNNKIGLSIVHSANNAFQGWPEYNLMIGMGWRDNGFGDRMILDADGKETRVPKGQGPGAGHGPRHAFAVTIRDPEHPVTKGMPREFLHAKDELYHGMRGPIQNVHLLATAFSDKKQGGTGEHEPMMWTVKYGKGRVFHTPMGHDLEAMNCTGFIATVQRGTEWAATGQVTLALPANFPGPAKTSSAAAK